MKLQPIEIKDERIVGEILKFEQNSDTLEYYLGDYQADGLQMLDAAIPIDKESLPSAEREHDEFNEFCGDIVQFLGDYWDDNLLITTKAVDDGMWFFSKYFVLKLTMNYVVRIHFNVKCPPSVAAIVSYKFRYMELRDFEIAKSYIIDEGGGVKNFE